MNVAAIIYILGYVLTIEAAFMLLPCVTAIIYGEKQGIAFLIVMLITLAVGTLFRRKKPKKTGYYAREGFLIVALSWIAMSAFGCLPFVINGDIPNFIDALFETVSGFTTTGASILSAVEPLAKCSLMWRSFTHWIGGMGVIVFLLAIIPLAGGQNIQLMRAESPGPSVGKLVPKIKETAMLLYKIYMVLTFVEMGLLIACRMPVFDSIAIAFGTAGTGGFGVRNSSCGEYTPLQQNVITVFLVLFGINFNMYYFIIAKKFKQAFNMEEVKVYLLIIICSVFIIGMNIMSHFPSGYEAFRTAAFQVGSIISTTGFSSADLNDWPWHSRSILVAIMIVGACAGSTAGGIKVSRLIILLKGIKKEVYKIFHPRSVQCITLEGRPISEVVERTAFVFFGAYIMILLISFVVVAFNGYSSTTTLTAVIACISNIGPGLDLVGPMGNYGFFSVLTKSVLIFDMLAGRLEVFPMLLLIMPAAWRHSGDKGRRKGKIEDEFN